MTKGKWRYEKSGDHHHVCIGEESYDINSESDAKMMAASKEMYRFIRAIVSYKPQELSGDIIHRSAKMLLKKIKTKKERK